MKRIELALRMVALLLVLELVVINLPARGDDCACLTTDACAVENSTATRIAATPGATDVTVSFLAALNAEREKRNLQPVIHSDRMATVAARNNAVQAVRGLGHWVLEEGLGQCAATGQVNEISALRDWINSPPHAAIIFARDLSMIGYHQLGLCHTVATFQGGYVESSPAQPAPVNSITPAPCVGSCPSVPGPMQRPLTQGCGYSQPAPLIHFGGPGRSGFRPLARLFSRARVTIQFGVQVQF